jgi:hypothetical protein
MENGVMNKRTEMNMLTALLAGVMLLSNHGVQAAGLAVGHADKGMAPTATAGRAPGRTAAMAQA